MDKFNFFNQIIKFPLNLKSQSIRNVINLSDNYNKDDIYSYFLH